MNVELAKKAQARAEEMAQEDFVKRGVRLPAELYLPHAYAEEMAKIVVAEADRDLPARKMREEWRCPCGYYNVGPVCTKCGRLRGGAFPQ